MKLHLAPGESTSRIATRSHQRRHLSDQVAAVIVTDFGTAKYGSGARIPGNRVVWIGRGGYDEHDPENMPESRFPHLECEATLAARDNGVRNLIELQPLLHHAVEVDCEGRQKEIFMFGRLAELIHHRFPNEPWRADRFVQVVIRASIANERATNGEREVLDPARIRALIWHAFRLASKEYDGELAGWLEERLKEALQPGQEFLKPFGLAYCVGLLLRMFRKLPKREGMVVEWLIDAFHAEFIRQRMFLEAKVEVEELKALSEMAEHEITVSGKRVKIAVVHSDSERIYSAVWKLDKRVAVLMVRRSTGHVQIFRRNRTKVNIELWSVCAQIRALEQAKLGIAMSSWAELTSQVGPEEGRRWFFFQKMQSLFNGGPTDPETEATALSDGEVLECLVRGLEDSSLSFRTWLYLEMGGEV